MLTWTETERRLATGDEALTEGLLKLGFSGATKIEGSSLWETAARGGPSGAEKKLWDSMERKPSLSKAAQSALKKGDKGLLRTCLSRMSDKEKRKLVSAEITWRSLSGMSYHEGEAGLAGDLLSTLRDFVEEAGKFAPEWMVRNMVMRGDVLAAETLAKTGAKVEAEGMGVAIAQSPNVARGLRAALRAGVSRSGLDKELSKEMRAIDWWTSPPLSASGYVSDAFCREAVHEGVEGSKKMSLMEIVRANPEAAAMLDVLILDSASERASREALKRRI